MTIENLGVKLYSGTKVDRKSDSLGSSADGVNSGITLLTNPTTNNGTATNSASNADRCEVWQLTETIPEGAVITKLKVQYRADESSTNTKLVLYQDNGSGTPTTLLAYTAQFNPNVSDGWYEANIAYDGSGSSASSYTVTSSTAGRMWVGIWANADSSIYSSTVSGSMKSMSLTYAGGATAPTSTFSVTDTYNMKGNCGIVSTLGNPQKLGTGAYECATTTGYVDCGSNSDWNFLHNSSAKFTIAGWYKTPTAWNSTLDLGFICESSAGSSTGAGISLKADHRSNARTLSVEINSTSAQVVSMNITNFFPDDYDWHHIALTYDQSLANTNMVAYLDGVQKGTANKTGNSPSDANSEGALRFGTGVGSHKQYYGKWNFDDFGIFKRVLTGIEISTLSGVLSGTPRTSYNNLQSDSRNIAGTQFLTGHKLIGESVTKVKMRFKNLHSLSGGTITCKILNNDKSVKTTFSSISTGDIDSSTYEEFTFTGSATTIAVNDIICAEITNSASNDIEMGYSGAEANAQVVEKTSGSWSSSTSNSITYKVVESDGALVSSLTNKSEGKAYYSMDSTSLSSTLDITSNSGFTSNVTGISTDSNGKITNAGTGCTANTGVWKSLGFTLGSTWCCTFRYKRIGSGSPNDNWNIPLSFTTNGTEASGNSSTTNDSVGLGNDTNFNAGYKNGANAMSRTYTGEGATVDTYFYVKMIRTTSTNLRIQTYNNSDFSDTPVTYNKTLSGVDGDLTHLFAGAGVNNNTWGYEVDQIKIYNNATDNQGCANDFSTTSDLEALSGVRTNSLFIQTDNVPKYFWYQADGTWEISGIPTPDAWWDMSASDTTVSNVTDKTGNGHTLVQSTSGYQPSIASSAQNGLNALQFTQMSGQTTYDGDFMTTTDNMTLTPKQTIFFAGKVVKGTVSGGSGWNYYVWDSGDTSNHNSFLQSTDNWKLLDGGSDPTTAETTWSVWRQLTVQYNGSSSFLRDNGTESALSGTLESGNSTTGFTLNGWQGKKTGSSDHGQYGGSNTVGEVIIYNSILNSAQIKTVEAYLKEKWGTP